MLSNEARWLGERLQKLPPETLSPVINIGSSTNDFRKIQQPFIQSFIIEPMETRGVKFIHVDQKPGSGIDIHGDIYDLTLQRKIRAYSPMTIMCCNLFEHVEDREKLADMLMDMLPRDGYLVITVPYSFPYHTDPIDTLYRPNIDEMAEMFPKVQLVDASIVSCGTYADVLKKQPALLPRHLARSILPFPGYHKWIGVLHRWKWLFKPYQVTCFIGKKID